MINQVDVFLDQGGMRSKEVGRARFNLRRGQVSTTFTYSDAYMVDENSFPIDPSLPIASTTHHVDGLPGVFRDSSPDRWGRRLIAKRCRVQANENNLAAKNLDEVDFLLGVHDEM